MQYLLLFHGSNGYENAPVTFIRTIASLVFDTGFSASSWSYQK